MANTNTYGGLPLFGNSATPSSGTVTSVSVTPGAGISATVLNPTTTPNIIISATGSGLSWDVVTGTTQALAVSAGYIIDNAALVTLSLPLVSVAGDTIYIVGRGAGGWTLTQAAGQQIFQGSTSTTSGITGSVQSTTARSCIQLVCSVANLEWTIIASQDPITFI